MYYLRGDLFIPLPPCVLMGEIGRLGEGENSGVSTQLGLLKDQNSWSRTSERRISYLGEQGRRGLCYERWRSSRVFLFPRFIHTRCGYVTANREYVYRDTLPFVSIELWAVSLFLRMGHRMGYKRFRPPESSREMSAGGQGISTLPVTAALEYLHLVGFIYRDLIRK